MSGELEMPGRSHISHPTTRMRQPPSARNHSETISILRDPDLIVTAAVAAIGLLVTAALIRATDGADLAAVFLAPLN